MAIDTTLAPNVFQDLFRERNEPGWATIAALLARAGEMFQVDLLPNLTETVRNAKDTAATLFCAVLAAKREGETVYTALRQLVDDAEGRSFGARLVNFTLSRIDAEISDDLRTAWAGIKQQMTSTIELLMRQLMPTIPDYSPLLQPEQVVVWIDSRGGIGKLHTDFMTIRRVEKQNETARKEADRKAGQLLRQLKEAEAFFSDNPTLRPEGVEGENLIRAHLTAQAALRKEQQEQLLRSKFGTLKARLVRNGSIVADLPPDDRLLIARGGKLYLISDHDEFLLLSCEAGVL